MPSGEPSYLNQSTTSYQSTLFSMRKLKNLVFVVLGAFALTACENNDQPAPVLAITGISPAQGPVGSDVTITGTQFSATAADNEVKFGNAVAAVKTASPTELVVTVPGGATNGPISVTVAGQTVQSTQSFTVSARTVVEIVGIPQGQENPAAGQVEITANTTWTANNVYLLKNFVYVKSGATLTIQPGTVIKGDKDTKATLIIEQGARIIAEGTPTAPIIFTSNQPRGQRNYGDWGGVVLIGKAPHNREGARVFEGGIRGRFGTLNEPADNSGILKYVRIEFPGVPLSNAFNSEINGLTMYGVGSGTVIDYVQVSYSGDDTYEWFGGTVNAKHLVALRGFDDEFDTDWGWSGKVQYAVALRDPQYADQSTSNGFESDNFDPGTPATGPNAGLPLTAGQFANISVFAFNTAPVATTQAGSGPYGRAMHLRRNTSISVFNSLFVGYPEGLRLDGTATFENATAGRMRLEGIVLANMTKPLAGAGGVTDAQVTEFFNATNRQNQIVSLTDLGILRLNGATFTLTAPNFVPQSGSPLLTGGVTLPSGFEPTTYRGAFNTTDWTAGWTNYDPQNTDYN
jgi:hypothetical protein